MKLNSKQIEALYNLKNNFCLLNFGDYGFYSDKSIGVICSDKYGDFSVTINVNGIITSWNYGKWK